MTRIVAVDQGTSSTKAMLVDDHGVVGPRATIPVTRNYPRPGWVEQDPDALWASVRAAISQLGADDGAVLALSTQRESVLAWNRADGRPLTPCVSWQCSRGAAICADLVAAGAATLVKELTGLPLDPMFSASKLRYLFDTNSALRSAAEAGEACVGTVDSWLLWQLSGGRLHATDLGNASRTLLLDISRQQWSDELLDLFHVPQACLPEIIPSSGPIGETATRELPHMTIGACLADSHAAAYGLGCIGRGAVKATYGTGTSLLAPTGATTPTSDHGLAGTIAWSIDGSVTYALEGNVYASGATVEWLANMLGVNGAGDIERLAAGVADSAGVHIVPAFSGLGAPYWRPQARAAISGLSFATGRGHVARAALDSIALQVTDLVHALEMDLEHAVVELRVDGGASDNDWLMQRQADLLGCPVVRLDGVDAAALGATLVAAAAVGTPMESSGADESVWTRFSPDLGQDARAEQLSAWRAAVARALEAPEQVIA